MANLIHFNSWNILSKNVITISWELVHNESNLYEVFSYSVKEVSCFYIISFYLSRICLFWLLRWLAVVLLIFFVKFAENRSIPVLFLRVVWIILVVVLIFVFGIFLSILQVSNRSTLHGFISSRGIHFLQRISKNVTIVEEPSNW